MVSSTETSPEINGLLSGTVIFSYVFIHAISIYVSLVRGMRECNEFIKLWIYDVLNWIGSMANYFLHGIPWNLNGTSHSRYEIDISKHVRYGSHVPTN